MGGIGTFTLLDFSEEKGSFSFYAGDITAVSLPGFLTEFGSLRTATENLTRGTMHQEQWVGDRTVLSQIPPTDPDAQREDKLLVTYQGDVSQKLFQLEIPTLDRSIVGLLIPGSDDVDLAQTEMAAWVTAFEQIARSPDSDTETVTVISARYVGRNL